MTRLFLSVHKWVGIALGVLLFIWLASGVVMVLPMKLIAKNARPGDVAVSGVTLSPAAAAQLVRTRDGDTSAVKDWSLEILGDQAYYRIVTAAKGNFLINGTTGARLEVNKAVAETLATARLPKPLPVASVTEVKKFSLGYPNGPLPAWRVEFADGAHTVAYVGKRDGSVGLSTGLHRVRYFIAQMHTFDQIRTLGLSRAAQHVVLALTSAVAVLLVITGYYLVLPRRWRRRWEQRPA